MKPWVPLAAFGLALSPLAVVHPATVHGRSMEPTLRPGERIWVLRAWAAGRPRVGEIWFLEGPDGRVVKRVAAVDSGIRVLGDNPDLSVDSRIWGSLQHEQFLGRILGR